MSVVLECGKNDDDTQFWVTGNAGFIIQSESPIPQFDDDDEVLLRSEEICNPDANDPCVECRYDFDFPPQTGCAPCLDPFCSLNVAGRKLNVFPCAQITDDTLRLVEIGNDYVNDPKKSDSKTVEFAAARPVCGKCDKNNFVDEGVGVKKNGVNKSQESQTDQSQVRSTWCEKYVKKPENGDEFPPSIKKVIEEMQAKISYLESCLRQLSLERETKNKKVQVPPPDASLSYKQPLRRTDAASI